MAWVAEGINQHGEQKQTSCGLQNKFTRFSSCLNGISKCLAAKGPASLAKTVSFTDHSKEDEGNIQIPQIPPVRHETSCNSLH